MVINNWIFGLPIFRQTHFFMLLNRISASSWCRKTCYQRDWSWQETVQYTWLTLLAQAGRDRMGSRWWPSSGSVESFVLALFCRNKGWWHPGLYFFFTASNVTDIILCNLISVLKACRLRKCCTEKVVACCETKFRWIAPNPACPPWRLVLLWALFWRCKCCDGMEWFPSFPFHQSPTLTFLFECTPHKS